MNIQRRLKVTSGLVMSVGMLGSMSVAAFAQQAGTIEGMITGRSGPTMSVRTADTPRQLVVLSDSTKATEKGGFLGLGKRDLGITELVPGLAVKVEGNYDADHKLVAKKVTFSRGSYKTAKQIDAGLNPVNEEVAAAQDELKTHSKNIEAAQNDITRQGQDLETTKQGLATTTEATNMNKQAIGQTNGRIGQLDQYDTKNSLTINFANGRSTLTKKSKQDLDEFVKTIGDTAGYMIQVQGYASKVGSPAINQRLSSERANAVITEIQQSGDVPLTRILAPAAMGTTNQTGNNHTRKGQAENRRVVVTILVNKGITAGNAS